MICPYCQENCVFVFEGMTTHQPQEQKEEMWSCNKHILKVEYLIRFNRKPNCPCQDWADQKCCPVPQHYKTIIRLPYNGKTFLAILDLVADELRIKTYDAFHMYTVLALVPTPPNLTPETLKKKLPLWVMFS